MKVLIVDDEPIAQEILEKFCAKLPQLQLVGSCDNAIAALQAIQDHQPDLLFLDIQMPEMTGLELIRVLGQQRVMVIFTTAFHEHALESYELDAVDYLLKPIAFDRFVKAVAKASELMKLRQAAAPGQPAATRTYVWAKEGRKKIQLCIEDIIVVQALRDYMEIYLPTGKVLVNITMNKMEELLPAAQFLRINRSCIVRKHAIQSIQDMHVYLQIPGLERMPIGPTYWEAVKQQTTEIF